MKKKLIIITSIVIICMAAFLWCFSTKTIHFSGSIMQEEQTVGGYIEVCFKRYNLVINTGEVNGSISILNDSEKLMEEYEIAGVIYETEDVYWSAFSYYHAGRNQFEAGDIYLDKEMKNVVFETEDLKFVSANESFIEEVEAFTGKDGVFDIDLNMKQELSQRQEVLEKFHTESTETIVFDNPQEIAMDYIPKGAECTEVSVVEKVVYIDYRIGNVRYIIGYYTDGNVEKVVREMDSDKVYTMFWNDNSASSYGDYRNGSVQIIFKIS